MLLTFFFQVIGNNISITYFCLRIIIYRTYEYYIKSLEQLSGAFVTLCIIILLIFIINAFKASLLNDVSPSTQLGPTDFAGFSVWYFHKTNKIVSDAKPWGRNTFWPNWLRGNTNFPNICENLCQSIWQHCLIFCQTTS